MGRLKYTKISPEHYDKILAFGGKEYVDQDGQKYLVHPKIDNTYMVRAESIELR